MALHFSRKSQSQKFCLLHMNFQKKHRICRKDPNSTRMQEEAALKASGPMPCALLIVTSAFLSSNSDWWGCQGWGGRVFWERLVVKNSVLTSLLSCQRADTERPETRGLCCCRSGHWPRFPLPPTPSPQTTSHLQNTPQLAYLICSSLTSCPGWGALLQWLLTLACLPLLCSVFTSVSSTLKRNWCVTSLISYLGKVISNKKILCLKLCLRR